ncbi:MAG: hypothetical protein VKJ66_11445 [Synechococcus sp.]|nr:hypothetical protein [Synechococcus sp.]
MRTTRPGAHRQGSPSRGSVRNSERKGQAHPAPETPSWEELLGRR